MRPSGQDQNRLTLEVNDLKMYFPVTKGLLRRKIADVQAVDGVSFSIKHGETLGLVGESGCGKSTVGRCVTRLYQPTGGTIKFEGQDITTATEDVLRPMRRRFSIVFQDPYASLNPRHSIGSIVGEPIRVHKLVKGKGEYKDRVADLFQMCGLDPNMVDRYPHELSGGQRQRVAVARALAGEPSLIVCDEPVSALDVSIQAQIINLLKELQEKISGLSFLFISHDLFVVEHISARVAVMYLGQIVEIANFDELYDNPRHPYTRALMSAVPTPDPRLERERHPIILEGETPSPLNPPSGCRFHPRCPEAIPACREQEPLLKPVSSSHQVACIRVGGLLSAVAN